MKLPGWPYLRESGGAALWQSAHGIGMLLASWAVIQSHGTAAWGSLVPLMVFQQLSNVVIAWGAKDWLQKQFADQPGLIGGQFLALLRDRSFILLIIAPLGWLLFPGQAPWLLLMIFGRFAQQSFDFWVIKSRRFARWTMLEYSFIAAATAVLLRVDIEDQFKALSIWFFLRGITSVAFHHTLFRSSATLLPVGRAFLKARSFALVSAAGTLASRADLLVLSFWLKNDPALLGTYQLVMAFVWNIQAIAQYASSSRIPHFYRADPALKARMGRSLLYLGMALIPICLAIMYVLMRWTLSVQLPSMAWPLIASTCLLPYIITPWVYRIFSFEQQVLVVRNMLFQSVSFALLLWLLHDTLLQLLWAAVITSALQILAYAANMRSLAVQKKVDRVAP